MSPQIQHVNWQPGLPQRPRKQERRPPIPTTRELPLGQVSEDWNSPGTWPRPANNWPVVEGRPLVDNEDLKIYDKQFRRVPSNSRNAPPRGPTPIPANIGCIRGTKPGRKEIVTMAYPEVDGASQYSDTSLGLFDADNTPAEIMLGGFEPIPPEEFLPKTDKWLNAKFPPDLPNEPALARRMNDNGLNTAEPVPVEVLEEELNRYAAYTAAIDESTHAIKVSMKPLVLAFREKAELLYQLNQRAIRIEGCIDLVMAGVVQREPKTAEMLFKDIRFTRDEREKIIYFRKKNKQTRLDALRLEEEVLELRLAIEAHKRQYEQELVNRQHDDPDLPGTLDGTSDNVEESTQAPAMSEKARGKLPEDPFTDSTPTNDAIMANTSRLRHTNRTITYQLDQSGCMFNSRGMPIYQVGPPIEDLVPNPNPIYHIPAWFRVLEASRIINFRTATTTQERFKDVLNKLASLHEEAELQGTEHEPKLFDKFWHDEDEAWHHVPHRRRGGWWKCRQGPDVDPAENNCQLCHGPTELIEYDYAKRVTIKSRWAESLNWVEPESLDYMNPPVWEEPRRNYPKTRPAAETIKVLMGFINDAQRHVAEEDKRIALARIHADRATAELNQQRMGWKLTGGFITGLRGEDKSIKALAKPLPQRKRTGNRTTELLGPIALWEEERKRADEESERKKAEMRNADTMIYGMQQGQVWDATAYARCVRAKYIGQHTSFQRKSRDASTRLCARIGGFGVTGRPSGI